MVITLDKLLKALTDVNVRKLLESNGLSLLFVLLFLSGCVSTSPKNKPSQSVTGPEQGHLASILRQEADLWSGTPHVLGGTSRRGIDCSALVQTVYKDLLDVNLPRTTAQQSKVGESVRPQDVQVGDLVFYRINRRTRHVGIYVGDDEFMHASKSAGVTISSIDDAYWKKRFWMVRRILETDQSGVDESVTVQTRSRVRW